MQYGYYPGCSLERNAGAYHESTMAVAGVLGLQFTEVDDWNCCGATEFFSVNQMQAYALTGRNLALAADQFAPKPALPVIPVEVAEPPQLVAPCSACYLNLSKVDRYLASSPELAAKVNTALDAGGLHYDPGSLRVRHLLDVMVNDAGYDAIAARVQRALTGLRVAPYYGCLVVRPGFQGQFDDPEYPTTLDKLMRVLGAKVVDFPLKAHCCGGHMTQISEEVALELLRRLLKNAADYQADVIVTLCPMCQLNLDVFQRAVNRRFGTNFNLPVLFFTQLMGLAFGLAPERLGIGKEFVASRPALAKIGTSVEVEQERAVGKRAKQRNDQSLPMPYMPEEEER
ncbi:CoB--CoM heterodisulfide reductase iron-sulfur subunit B family protein [Candidatus Chloroploca sp. M-50]|uniref:CoB--CoM heterodisulfide reductase iron-sulfur subunit B family protein n=1 Tax=Candidatus Chloroploca mongolica TaxID=2528176 RepID=A0ABS4D3T9_9CHLR|nr:CoB--CoM heterodisulfide reductase iron-sulfur subunit B family protein [Candidatus Chloroploca mongolica]MBP1464111.1 CoB--CoM heterodisulfide reductase iron-sulfur subunit B family protein [Candidatus Chloroploca mongolica]